MTIKYRLDEHTPMGDRQTYVTFEKTGEAVSGAADIDAAPGQRDTVAMQEIKLTETEFSFLIEAGGMPRRYTGAIDGENVSGAVVFEGDSELAGIRTEFDGQKEA